MVSPGLAVTLTVVADQGPRLPVPARNSDGTVVTADQIVERAVAAEPYRYRLPEQQIELRNWATVEARKEPLSGEGDERVIVEHCVSEPGTRRAPDPE